MINVVALTNDLNILYNLESNCPDVCTSFVVLSSTNLCWLLYNVTDVAADVSVVSNTNLLLPL